ncbi:MAG: hypothetical protein JXR88_04605 [Clostridia bacterium]|nr:hypothetical protein [Clostridia bacterium]
MQHKLLFLLVLVTTILSGCTMGLEGPVDMEGLTYDDLEPLKSYRDFNEIKCDFGFQEAEEDLYVGEYHQFKITSHGYPSQYIYYIVDNMYENYDDLLKSYEDLDEESIELHFYMNEKAFKKVSILPNVYAITIDNVIHFKMTTDDPLELRNYMNQQVYIAGLHELEHVFQYWHLGEPLKNYSQTWLLEALASYKSYFLYDISKVGNLSGFDTFYITDFYSMMGSVWCYQYGYYLIDYFIEDLGLAYVDILDQPDVDTLTGMTKAEIFEGWKVFMEEKYNLVYKSEGNE